jgi:hypothetical protein
MPMKKIIIIVVVLIAIGYLFTANRSPLPTGYVKADELAVDLNADGKTDYVYLLGKDTGTTTAYYAVASIDSFLGFKITDPQFIANKISPQNIELTSGQIVINYSDRAPGEPLSTEARFWNAKIFEIQNGQLVRIKKI